MRLFVALSLPEEIRQALASLTGGLPGARWVPPENYHLTLRFIGQVHNGEAEDIDDALTALRGKGFELSLKGLGCFCEGPRPTSLWAGVQADEGLTRLQAKVESALVRAGLRPEKRKFTPHVTLARFKHDPGPKLHQLLTHHALFRTPPFQVEDFVLYSSYLAHTGAIYEPERVYELEPAA
jgi:2'-5' RNA ligase